MMENINLIGKQVILSTDTKGVLPTCGEVVDIIQLTRARVPIMVVWDHTERRKVLAMCVVAPYSKEFWEHIHELDWDQMRAKLVEKRIIL